MNSKKIKAKEFLTNNGKSVAQIVALPEKGMLRLYIAWENEPAAKDGFMGFFKSRILVDRITTEAIEQTKNFGVDIAHLPECQKIFKALF
ncbi:hypothetical protein [Flavicella sp.]|uniref:hypothetical protein n=1 Tax=Flavicella sp. TaxID=2957742 RepID=UPI00301A1488